MKFTIITATIGRASLARACKSIEDQTHHDWQHIVMVDGPAKDPLPDLAHHQREFHHFIQPHKDGGSFVRHEAFPYVLGDYVLYLDDDDYYLPQALKTLDQEIKGEMVGVFPISFCGMKGFCRIPPGEGNTSICQYYHKPFDDKGLALPYPCEKRYAIDSWWAGELAGRYGYSVIKSDDLVIVEKLSCPNFNPLDPLEAV